MAAAFQGQDGRFFSEPALLVGISVDLEPGRAQTGHAVSIDVAFPGEYLIDRQVVELAGVLYWEPASTHGIDDGGLAPNRPSLSRRR